MRINRFMILTGIFITIMCFSIFAGLYLHRSLMQRNVRDGLDNLKSNILPMPPDFALEKMVSYDLTFEASGKRCYYARDYLVLGSTLPALDAIDTYVASLLASDWIDNTSTEYPFSRGLIYGENVTTVVRAGDPGVDVRDTIDYPQLQRTYESVIFVRIDFAIPHREGC